MTAEQEQKWRVVRVTRWYEAVEAETYPNADQAAAAAFGYRSKFPTNEYEIERLS